MADQGGNSMVIRDYRKGNWTLGETMVLIEAKKMDDERRMKRSSENEGGGIRSKPAELRWKWVEDYCWRKGCLRSQNQCNDKWDNLMRDYKKIRDYERRLAQETGLLISNSNTNEANKAAAIMSSSYWKLEKNERKDKNLPSNMLPHVYEALVEVVERKYGGGGQRLMVNPSSSNTATTTTNNPNVNYGVIERLPLSATTPLLQHQVTVSIPLSPPPPPPPLLQTQAQSQPLPPPLYSQALPAAVDTDETTEYSDTPAKRQRRRRRDGGDQERSSGASGSATMEMGTAISRSASVIAEAIQASEESKERRHRDLLNLRERRLQIEESNTQTNTQSINALVDAINNLANSILALASHKNKS